MHLKSFGPKSLEGNFGIECFLPGRAREKLVLFIQIEMESESQVKNFADNNYLCLV